MAIIDKPTVAVARVSVLVGGSLALGCGLPAPVRLGASPPPKLDPLASDKHGAVRIGDCEYRFVDPPNDWFGNTVLLDMPMVTNLRLDPFDDIEGIEQIAAAIAKKQGE
jgi:hypothetical protein